MEVLELSPIFIRGIIVIFKEMLINEQITADEVRLLNQSGEQMGIVSLQDALNMASSESLDLVLLNGSSKPVVCKIMDYGKFKFDSIKREKEIKKNQKVSNLKEIIIKRMTIDTHDLETKAKHGKRFLQDGDKVKVVLWMKGREQAYSRIAIKVMKNFASMLEEFGTVDKKPEVVGKNIIMIITPKK